MFVIQIISTVFDALIMFFISAAIIGEEEKKYVAMGSLFVATLIMNLFCIWGRV